MPDFINKIKSAGQENVSQPNPTKPTMVWSAGPKKKKKKSFLFKSLIGLVLAIILALASLVTRVVMSINTTNETSGRKVSLLQQIAHIIVNPEKTINGESEDRVNILVMGIGGAGHEGPLLADTIILFSLKPSTSEVAMVSIPRDLLANFPQYGLRKINNAIYFGQEMKYSGGGEALLSKMVSEVTGLTIHYYARLDFEGFRKIIDDVGGLDINVENSFTDYQYPDYNHGYQTITFKKGWQHMNGERALQFVRSRHGNNGEGSDFARSKRQEKVIIALKQKMLSFGNIITPTNIISALDSLGTHSRTNLEAWEMIRVVKLASHIKQNQVITKVLDASANGLLKSATTAEGAYVLEPKAGDFSEVRDLVSNIFNISRIAKENAKIEIQNGTGHEGLAREVADSLTNQNFNVVAVSNAASLNYQKTIIYDLSAGHLPYTVTSLKNKFKEADITSTIPSFLTNSSNLNYDNLTLTNIPSTNKNTNQKAVGKADILIIVGLDQVKSQLITSPTSFKQ